MQRGHHPAQLYALTVHISVAQIGLIFGAQGVASIVSRPFLGESADRVGRQPFIMVGVALCAAVLGAIPHLRSFLPPLGASTLFGLGTGMVTPATTAMIGDLVKRGDFGAAMGVFGSLWGIGHAAGPLVAGCWSPGSAIAAASPSSLPWSLSLS